MIRKIALSDDLLEYGKDAISLSQALDDRPYLAVCTADHATVAVKNRYQWLHLVVVNNVKEGRKLLREIGEHRSEEGLT